MTRRGSTRYSTGLFLNVVTISLVVYFVDCHPQCLDSRPPFEAETKLSFCPNYATFGCCTGHDDTSLQQRYQRMQSEITANNTELWSRCSSYVKTFLCETCSPYAAHIFDSEINQYETKVDPRSFPGLCSGYCTSFYNLCKDVVHLFLDKAGQTERFNLEQGLKDGVSSFCNKVSLVDVDYCFPELQTNPILQGNITLEQITKPGCLCMETFQNNTLRNPIFLKHANDGSGRMFIGEQLGLVHIFYPNGTKLKTPFIDIMADTLTTSSKGDERGMLGMTFHPEYKDNGKFYIYYSTYINSDGTNDHKIRIEEFRVNSTDPNRADISSGRIIIEILEPYWNHNGGEILFGLDNYLYLFVGDGGKAGDPLQSGQDMYSLLGKVLRIDVDNTDIIANTEYAIPADNPFADGRQALPEIYAYGVRNIWRCGMDRGDRKTGYGRGRIVCGDVGQSAVEELDLLQKGANYGWNLKEGSADFCYYCKKAFTSDVLTPPIFEYNHTVGKSVTGGHFYRGCESPNLNGFYIYGDFMSGKLFRLLEEPSTGRWSNKELNMCGPDFCTPPMSSTYSTSIISFGEDEAGEVYMLSTSIPKTNVAGGSVYKIVDPSRRGNPALCKQQALATPPPVVKYTPTTPPTTSNPIKTIQGIKTTQPVLVNSQSPTGKPTSGSEGHFVSGARMVQYLDYYKQHALRQRRRKLQDMLKEETKERERNLVTFRREPPHKDASSTLVFHGISIKRCSPSPTLWCSLKRFVP